MSDHDTNCEYNDWDGPPCRCRCDERAFDRQVAVLLIRAYTDGYGRGHNDTVEGDYVDILPCDRDTYFAEEMTDWISEQGDSDG